MTALQLLEIAYQETFMMQPNYIPNYYYFFTCKILLIMNKMVGFGVSNQLNSCFMLQKVIRSLVEEQKLQKP